MPFRESALGRCPNPWHRLWQLERSHDNALPSLFCFPVSKTQVQTADVIISPVEFKVLLYILLLCGALCHLMSFLFKVVKRGTIHKGTLLARARQWEFIPSQHRPHSEVSLVKWSLNHHCSLSLSMILQCYPYESDECVSKWGPPKKKNHRPNLLMYVDVRTLMDFQGPFILRHTRVAKERHPQQLLTSWHLCIAWLGRRGFCAPGEHLHGSCS